MNDWIAWFMLAAATFLAIGVRLRPLGLILALAGIGFMLLSFRPAERKGP